METILVVDDEKDMLNLLKRTLEPDLNCEVITAETGHIALEILESTSVDLVLADIKMPGMDGAELFHQIKTIKPRLPVTIITGYPDSEIMARALAQGPFGVMEKPFGEADIVSAVTSFLGITHPEHKINSQQQELEAS